MVDRDRVGLFSLLVVFIVVPLTVTGQTQSELPRTDWGQPDIQGVWDLRTITPMSIIMGCVGLAATVLGAFLFPLT